MNVGTGAKDTKPKHTDEHTDDTLTITDEHIDKRQTCEDAVDEVEPVEGGHEGRGHKAKTY